MKHYKLMIPGPVDIFDETLDTLAEQSFPSYSTQWSPYYWETVEMLQEVFQTQNDIVIITAPGSGGVETGVSNLFARGEKVAAVSNGPFANRKNEIMRQYGIEVIEVTSEWGTPVALDDVAAVLRQHPDIAGVTVVANATRCKGWLNWPTAITYPSMLMPSLGWVVTTCRSTPGGWMCSALPPTRRWRSRLG
ncbi:MAG TPA: hypothetical protein PKE45_10140 [Caldilineaceae bacterium]|nr:hypothetical protein [Caldilineaceae bacterium]